VQISSPAVHLHTSKRSQQAVSRILCAFAFPACRLRSPHEKRLRRDDHSSSPDIADGVKRPTRRHRTGRPNQRLSALPRRRRTPPYLVLLRAGFCLPPMLPRARCALTAPFHPYPPPRRSPRRAAPPKPAHADEGRRYVFCATFLRVAPTGRYPAHCPAEFGLSSRRAHVSGQRRAAVRPAAIASLYSDRCLRFGARLTIAAPALPDRAEAPARSGGMAPDRAGGVSRPRPG
jgi:hypothetical protein